MISAVGQPIAGKLTVSDTTTLDLTRTGEGTENEPYDISGVVSIGALLSAGENITLTGAGSQNDPFIVSADEADEITGLIEAGLNVTITGTGTTADPYVIAATDGGPATSIAGLIEAGVNVTLTGAGTTADPYVIAVSSEITPTAITGLIQAGTRVTITGTGTTADPYVIAAAAPTATGLISAGNDVEIAGTGTTADPYVISAVLGTYNLVDVFGTGTATDDEVLTFDTNVMGGRWVPREPSWLPSNPEVRSQYLIAGATVWDPPSIPVGGQVSTTITVACVALSENWVFNVATGQLSGAHAWAAVTNTNVVTLYLSNMTTNAINLASRTWNVYGWR